MDHTNFFDIYRGLDYGETKSLSNDTKTTSHERDFEMRDDSKHRDEKIIDNKGFDSKETKSLPNNDIMTPHSERPLRPFRLYQWLDVKDSENAWLEGQVIDVNPSRIRVHYKGFPSKYDEDFHTDEKHPDSSRLALLHTYTKCPEKFVWPRKFWVGMNLDAQDSSSEWLPGTVLEISKSRGQVKIRYYEYSPKYDEWINFDSYRLAPLCTYTKGHNIKQTTPPPSPKKEHAYLSTDKEAKFLDLLKSEMSCIVEPMAEDGNCLFRAVSHQVYGDASYHQIVREKSLKYMKSQQSYFESFIAEDFDAYIARLQKDGEWGDQPEIQAMSELYGRPIQVYAYSTTPMKSYGSTTSGKLPIQLTYHFGSHYNSLVNSKTFLKSILKSRPGEVEEAHIKSFCRLGTVDKVKIMSDVEATEEEQTRFAIMESRKQFDSDNQDLLERIRKAKAESLKSQQEMESKQVEKAMLESVQECRPIYLAQQWGFKLRDCHEAYTLFKAPGVSDEIVAQKMIAYLLEERGQF